MHFVQFVECTIVWAEFGQLKLNTVDVNRMSM